MKSSNNIRHIDTAPSAVDVSDTAQQLTLLSVEPDTRARELPTSGAPRRAVHARFHLSKQTREIGLQHVAEIRRQLDEAKAARGSESGHRLPRRRPTAA